MRDGLAMRGWERGNFCQTKCWKHFRTTTKRKNWRMTTSELQGKEHPKKKRGGRENSPLRRVCFLEPGGKKGPRRNHSYKKEKGNGDKKREKKRGNWSVTKRKKGLLLSFKKKKTGEGQVRWEGSGEGYRRRKRERDHCLDDYFGGRWSLSARRLGRRGTRRSDERT